MPATVTTRPVCEDPSAHWKSHSSSHAPGGHKPVFALYRLSSARHLTLRDSEHVATSLNRLSTAPCSDHLRVARVCCLLACPTLRHMVTWRASECPSGQEPFLPPEVNKDTGLSLSLCSTHPGHTSQVLTAIMLSSFSVLLTGHEHSRGGGDGQLQCVAEVSV